MAEIVIVLPVPAGMEEFFAVRGMLVTPVTPEELKHYADTLMVAQETMQRVGNALDTFGKIARALAEVIASNEIADPAAVAETVGVVQKAVADTAGHLAYIREIFSRSAFKVSPFSDAEGPVQ